MAEQAGFSNACYAEHHFNDYSLSPSPLMMVAHRPVRGDHHVGACGFSQADILVDPQINISVFCSPPSDLHPDRFIGLG